MCLLLWQTHFQIAVSHHGDLMFLYIFGQQMALLCSAKDIPSHKDFQPVSTMEIDLTFIYLSSLYLNNI